MLRARVAPLVGGKITTLKRPPRPQLRFCHLAHDLSTAVKTMNTLAFLSHCFHITRNHHQRMPLREKLFRGWPAAPTPPWLRLWCLNLSWSLGGLDWEPETIYFHGMLRGESDCSKLRMRNDCDRTNCGSEAHSLV